MCHRARKSEPPNEVADYSIKTLPEETGVETVLVFSSDGTLAGTFGDSIVKNEDGMYTYTVYCLVNRTESE